MLLKKNGEIVSINDKDHINGYKNEGWEEVKEDIKPKEEPKPKTKTAKK